MVCSNSALFDAAKPDYVTALEQLYGAPSQAGIGSAVFYEPLSATADLEAAALVRYRYFVGALWARYGEDAWMGPWRQLYTRPTATSGDIVAELRSLDDREAKQSVSLIVDVAANAENALAAAFDHPAATELSIYKLGDGAAMNGILVAARRSENSAAIYLVFLLD